MGYRRKIPDGHSNRIYLVLKTLKLQNCWRIFDRPVSSMYCKYGEYACKLQTNLSMNTTHCHDMQKKCNIVLLFSKCRIYSICQNNMLMISKKNMINKTLQNIGKTCNIVCVSCRFWRLPSCLINISLLWDIPWENPRRAF